MSSFQRLWENIQAAKDVEPPHDDKAVEAIRTGIGIDAEFWDHFLSLLNNSEGLSKLLDIPVEKISSWRGKVQKCLSHVQDLDSEPEQKKNGKLLKTGLPEDIEEDETL